MSNEFQTGASISKRTKASSLMDSPLERPPGDNSLESNVEYEAKSSLKEETNNDLEVGSVLVENPLKSDVDVESVQNNATLGVKKKKKRKKKKKHNALEDSSVHNDLEEGSLFVKNLSPLKREVDVETAQNNETLVCKKKKKRNKQEKGLKALEDSNVHNKLENGSSLVDNHPPLERDSSLQPPFNCLEMDTEMADNSLKSDVEYEAKSNLKKETKKRNKLKRKHDASILGDQVDNQLQKDLETSQNNPALDRKPRKKRKNRKKKLNDASENCNVHNDREEDSVLAGNPPLKSDVDVESVQNNATLGVKKRKRKKNKNKKHNPLEDSSVHNDLEEGSLVENLSPLKRDVDVETAQNNEALVCNKKKKRNRPKKRLKASEDSNIHNELENGSSLVENPPPLQHPFNCLKMDVEMIDYTSKVSLHDGKKRQESTESYIDRMKEASVTCADGQPASSESKSRMKAEHADEIGNIYSIREDVSVLSNPMDRLEHTNMDRQDKIQIEVQDAVHVEKVLSEFTDKENFFNEPSGCDPSCKLLEQKNVLMEIIEEKNLSFSNLGPIEDDADLLINNKDNPPRVLISSPERALSGHCNILNDREEDSVLAENPPLKSDVDVESVQNNATLGVKKKRKRKNKKHNPLEDSSVHNDLEEGSLVENLSPLKRDVDVETAQNNEALVCKKKKKRNRPKKRPKASEDSNIHNELENGSSLVENPPPLQHPFNCLKMDVEMIDYTSKVSLHDGKKRQESIESNIDRMKEASVTCADGQPASGENKSRMKAERVDEIGNIYSIREDVSVLSNPMDRLEHTNMDRQEKIQIEVQDAVHVEKVLSEFTDNENFFNEPSGCDPSCKFLEQKNVLMEIIEEKNLSFSNLGPIEVDVDLLINNKDNPPRVLISSPERALSGHSRKKLLILDVNGLLADIVQRATSGYKPDTTIYGKKVFKRPFCEDFLQFCLERFDVGVWSSRKKKNVYRVLNFLMGNSIGKLLFCWDQTHCTRTKFKTLEDRNKPLVLKELRKLWEKRENYGEYNESNTLLLDDSPYKALRNPAHTAVFPNTYHYYYTQDCSLGPKGDLRVYLEGLATSENVQDYVKQNPFGQRPITESSLTWGFYSKIASVSSQQHNITKAHSPAVTYKKTKKKHSPAVTYKKKKKKNIPLQSHRC